MKDFRIKVLDLGEWKYYNRSQGGPVDSQEEATVYSSNLYQNMVNYWSGSRLDFEFEDVDGHVIYSSEEFYDSPREFRFNTGVLPYNNSYRDEWSRTDRGTIEVAFVCIVPKGYSFIGTICKDPNACASDDVEAFEILQGRSTHEGSYAFFRKPLNP